MIQLINRNRNRLTCLKCDRSDPSILKFTASLLQSTCMHVSLLLYSMHAWVADACMSASDLIQCMHVFCVDCYYSMHTCLLAMAHCLHACMSACSLYHIIACQRFLYVVLQPIGDAHASIASCLKALNVNMSCKLSLPCVT